ncbi:hypothetical protein HPB51_023420 [Rhipicephalus microplus]|uniref:Tick transposon n=1 Tax=Rhipicephalus microplus TaxID=6941 RepID=A0A9J6DY43_RHIMP|nr:hypothetical protein HPB51_023420 [Rhipicephalus microplus]
MDPLSSKTATSHNLVKVLNMYKGDGRRLLEDLEVKYLKTEKGQYPLTKANRNTLNTMLRKATEQALGVPIYSSTLRLLDKGTHNTIEDLIEAHLSNQRIRLSHTEHGRAVLCKI